MINLHHTDCMEYMAGLPDKAYDLAIVDPPYGISIIGQFNKSDTFKTSTSKSSSEWDNSIPPPEYFSELMRVSADHIIWGGNYFLDHLGKSNGFVIWDKMNGTNPMADAELAWTSFERASRMFRMHHFSAGYDKKIHPTQKPVALYRWLLKNYAKPGQRILDTHGGSMSIAIACDIEGFDLDLCELDKDYFEAGRKRLEQHQAQPRLFDAPAPQPIQLTL